MENHTNGRRVEHSSPAPQRKRSAKRKRSGKQIAGTILKVFGTLCLVGVLTIGIFAWIFMTYVRTSLAPELEVDLDSFTMNLSSTILYQDSDGNWQELEALYGDENRIWVDLEDIPQYAIDAAIAIEDERFETHHGVDWKRTAGAVVYMFFGMENTFGGSTITQQVIKNLTEYNDNTVKRKVTEIFRALELEKNYSKDDIMEVYLNKVYFGSHAYGIGAAAKTYFGKEAKDLTLAECASIIAITNNPSIYGPLYDMSYPHDTGEVDADGNPIYVEWTTVQFNKYRQELVLDKMLELGKITQEEHDAAVAEELIFVGTPEYEALHDEDGTADGENGTDEETASSSSSQVWSYFVDMVFEDVRRDLMEKYGWSNETAVDLLYNAGYTIYATIDPEIQAIAESVYEDVSNLDVQNSKGDQLQSAITIMDPYTGDILATVGGIGEKTGNRVGSYATARRPCGSAIKPVSVYAPAIENGVITPADVYDDYPVSLNNYGTGGYPKNSPTRYRGLMTIDRAVRLSSNTVAVRVLRELSFAASYDFMVNNLGFELDSADLAEAPLAMGGLTYGVTTVEMAAAFSAFANDGIYNEPRSYTQVLDADGNVLLDNTDSSSRSWVAMKETTAYQINQMLKGVVSSGTGTAARISGMTVAGKTGTTSNNYDRYFVGYTPYYCAAVWVGYGYNSYISYSGSNPAAVMWQKVMSQVHEGLENKDFHTPSGGLTSVRVCTASGLLAGAGCTSTQSVQVVSGSAPTETCAIHQTVEICTESGMLATENCPAETREARSYIAYDRENLIIPDGTTTVDPETGETIINGTPILAEDNDSLLQTIMAKGPCTVHTTPVDDPNNPDTPEGEDPNNPDDGDPSNPDNPDDPNAPDNPDHPDTPDPDDPNNPSEPDSGSGQPTEPETPTEPTEANDLSDWLNQLLE